MKKVLLLDGAMGTTINKEIDIEIKCKEKINILFPEKIENIHKRFIESGSDFIRANTFNCSEEALKNYGENIDESYNFALKGAEIAKRISEKYNKKSIGVFCLPGEKQILGILDGKVDLIMIETIFNFKLGLESLTLVREVMKRKNIKTPIMLSFTLCDGGKLYSGERLLDVIDSFIEDDIYSVGINCSCVLKDVENIFEKLREKLPKLIKITFHPNMNEGEKTYLNTMKKLLDKNLVDIIGGCCGSNYEHIKKLKELIK
ncbi:homocysteine S-methyltransferase family protein [uncultured Cetobacterium sp.]|uniref:homocysteine S-methyltransferase family protein n=2 Tax=uncultured Cetobacterium sp. TaxID=527638 RepID=UPI0026148700|nr:homocysteine S-methyltransferase family protein [uncultured Cetobacterium sp.]